MVSRKGQAWAISIMLGILIILLTIYLAPVLVGHIKGVMGTTSTIGGEGLDCSNPDISDFRKAQCVITDLTLPFFLGVCIALGGIVLIFKIIIQEVGQ